MNWYELLKLAGKDYDPYMSRVEDIYRLNTKPFDSWFNGKSRIYFPINIDKIEKIEPEIEVITLLDEYGYEIYDYSKGLCQNYKFPSKNKIRIGTTLEKIINNLFNEKRNIDINNVYEIKKIDEKIREANEAKHLFEVSAQREGISISLALIMISQDPHDIASMSTEKGWKSCLTLGKGEEASSVFCEVQNGAFIAYLFPLNKQLNNISNINIYDINNYNLKNPISRISIKRFYNSDNGKSIAIPDNTSYGLNVPVFKNFIKEWIENRQGDIEYGIYDIAPGTYGNSLGDQKYFLDKNLSEKQIFDIIDAPKKTIQQYEILDSWFYDFSEIEKKNIGNGIGTVYYFTNNSKIFYNEEQANQYMKKMEKINDRDLLSQKTKDIIKKYIRLPNKRYEIHNRTIDINEKIRQELIDKILSRNHTENISIKILEKIKQNIIDTDSIRIYNLLEKYPNSISNKDLDKISIKNPFALNEILIELSNIPNKQQEVNSWLLKYFSNLISNLKNDINIFVNFSKKTNNKMFIIREINDIYKFIQKNNEILEKNENLQQEILLELYNFVLFTRNINEKLQIKKKGKWFEMLEIYNKIIDNIKMNTYSNSKVSKSFKNLLEELR